MFIRQFVSALVVGLFAVACGGGYTAGNYEPASPPPAPVSPTVQETPTSPQPVTDGLPFTYKKPAGFVRTDGSGIMLLLERASDGATLAVNPFPKLTPASAVILAAIDRVKADCQPAGKIEKIDDADIYYGVFYCGVNTVTAFGLSLGGVTYLVIGKWPHNTEANGRTAAEFMMNLRAKPNY